MYIFTGPGLASCRRRPLSSNVRRQPSPLWSALVNHYLTELRGTSEKPAHGHHGAHHLRWQSFPSCSGQSGAAHRRSTDRAGLIRAPVHHVKRPRNLLHTTLSRGFVQRAPPNPSFKPSTNGVPRMPGLAVPGTFSPSGPARHTAGAVLTRTLGRTIAARSPHPPQDQ